MRSDLRSLNKGDIKKSFVSLGNKAEAKKVLAKETYADGVGVFRQHDKFFAYIKEKKGKYKHIHIKPISKVNPTELL